MHKRHERRRRTATPKGRRCELTDAIITTTDAATVAMRRRCTTISSKTITITINRPRASTTGSTNVTPLVRWASASAESYHTGKVGPLLVEDEAGEGMGIAVKFIDDTRQHPQKLRRPFLLEPFHAQSVPFVLKKTRSLLADQSVGIR